MGGEESRGGPHRTAPQQRDDSVLVRARRLDACLIAALRPRSSPVCVVSSISWAKRRAEVADLRYQHLHPHSASEHVGTRRNTSENVGKSHNRAEHAQMHRAKEALHFSTTSTTTFIDNDVGDKLRSQRTTARASLPQVRSSTLGASRSHASRLSVAPAHGPKGRAWKGRESAQLRVAPWEAKWRRQSRARPFPRRIRRRSAARSCGCSFGFGVCKSDEWPGRFRCVRRHRKEADQPLCSWRTISKSIIGAAAATLSEFFRPNVGICATASAACSTRVSTPLISFPTTTARGSRSRYGI